MGAYDDQGKRDTSYDREASTEGPQIDLPVRTNNVVFDTVETLSEQITVLQDRVSELRSRLEPVLTPLYDPLADGGVKAEENETAPLSSTLRRQRIRVTHLINDVNELLERLEL